MKKAIFIVFLLSTILSLFACNYSTQTTSLRPVMPNSETEEKTLDYPFEAQYIRTNGYIADKKYPVVTVVNSLSQLNNYYENNKDQYYLEHNELLRSEEDAAYAGSTIGFVDACERYDDTYFVDKNLVIVLLEEGSGSISHIVTDVKRNASNGKIDITIKRLVPEIGTEDMAQWHILVEIQKEVAASSDEINIVFTK